jgi:hypothetical protein
MKKTTSAKPRLSLQKATIKNLNIVHGGMMAVNPRTDCICCKACATAAC